ncbi:MAG: FAD-dependent oxidoreductase [Lysobacter sp.]
MGIGGARSALVIGGGAVGLACALRLRQRGLHTTLVDPMDSTSASLGNAGHIAIEQCAPLASWETIRGAPRRWFGFGGALDVRAPGAFAPWLRRFVRAAAPARFREGSDALRGLLEHAVPSWRALVRDIGRPDLLAEDGHVVLWESPRTADRCNAAWRAADIGTATLRGLDPAELDSYGLLLRHRPAGGIRFAGTGQIVDLTQLMLAMRQAFAARGGVCTQDRVLSLRVRDGRAEALLAGGDPCSADIVLVAAGVQSAELMATVGPRPPLIAERGYHVQWSAHDWPAVSSPVVFEDRSMIVTRFRDGLRAASFVEFAKPHSPPDPRKWAALRRHVAEVGLPTSGEGREWFGSRPTLPDYLPAIGHSPAASNLLYAFGHQHLGLTLAPITAEAVASLVTGDAPPVPLRAFDLQRFHSTAGSRT